MKPSEKPIDRLDQFFKNKLDDYTIAPSENAWAKVEAGLSKKNNVVAWRIAAAVLITGALITTIYWSQKNTGNDQPAVAQKKIEKAEPKTSIGNDSKTTEQKVESSVIAGNENVAPKKSSVKSVTQPSLITSEEIQKKEMIATTNQVEKITNDMNPEIAVEEKSKVEATPKTTVASSQQKPIKLEFTLDDSSVETVATTNEVKNTGLKKVLELAREMKEGEGPLTSLKEKKNELFARTSSREKKELNKLN
jgi:hypothetical protein